MRAFWTTVEKLDDWAFRALDKLDKKTNSRTFRERMEHEIKDVRAPQKAIQFDN